MFCSSIGDHQSSFLLQAAVNNPAGHANTDPSLSLYLCYMPTNEIAESYDNTASFLEALPYYFLFLFFLRWGLTV